MDNLPAGLPELLAPAGSLEALKAAVSCGADAVYLGGKRFSARQYAANLDDREIGEAVEFAHARGVRVYATVNTLLHDRELRDAAEFLIFLRETGVDAVLVQDPGLATLARAVIPGMPLHASTQMTLHSREGLEWAASLGLSRAVLARELSLAEVEAMGEAARRLGIGLEVFAHGALCYSWSGQCLLSSAIGGRSGNRGRCAQPCRRPYTLVRGRGDEYGRPRQPVPVPLGDRYLLSTKDLSLYPYLDRVVQAPIAALKIEGRMRSPEYVATVTGIYRKALDAIAAGSRVPQEPGSSRGEEARSGSSCPGGQGPLWTGERGPSGTGTWAPSPADEEALALTFNRGFTGGCLCEGPGGITGRDAPGHRGVRVGIVQSVDPASGSLGIRLTGSLVPEKGDGLVFRMPGGGEEEERGAILGHDPVIDAGILWMRAGQEAVTGIAEGAGAFITRRARLAGGAGCYAPATAIPRWPRIRVDLTLRVPGDGRPALEGSVYRNGVPVTVVRRVAGFATEPARARELTGREVEEILSRRGDAPFSIGRVRVEWPAGIYARKGAIGGLRRDLLADVGNHLVRSGMPAPGEGGRARELLGGTLGAGPSPALRRGRQSLVILTDTLAAVEGLAEEGSGYIALEPSTPSPPPDRAGNPSPGEVSCGIAREAAVMAAGSGWTLLWKWPRIAGDSWVDDLRRISGGGDRAMLPGLMVEGPGAALAAGSLFPGLPIHGGAGLNAWNARSVAALSRLFSSLTLSPELSREDLRELLPRARGAGVDTPLGFPVEGNLEVMVSEDRLGDLIPEGRGRERGDQVAGLQDGTGRIFPVGADICGRTRIANSVETCLIDRLPDLSSAGIGLLVIDARGRGARYAREMAALYRQGIALVEEGGPGMAGDLGKLRDECRMRARGGITRGPFLSGLKEET